jgi:hypothetical protein
MSFFYFFEGSGELVYSELKRNTNIKIGDTIDYISNNQLGYKKYKVILNKNGEKDLTIIKTYDDLDDLDNLDDLDDLDDIKSLDYLNHLYHLHNRKSKKRKK